MKPVRLAAVLALAAVSMFPTAGSAQTKPQGEPPRLVENVDVRVINVDVVVTDRKGNVINGLKRDDFVILENGVQKPVSNFYEVVGNKAILDTAETGAAVTAPAAPPAPAPVSEDVMRRRIIFYIDNLSMAPFNRNRVFQSMKDFIKNVMRPGDEAMIATFNRSMKVRVPFTRDPVQLQQTLDVIAGESAMGTANRSERKDVESQINDAQSYDDAVAAARQYAESVEHDLRQSVEAINGLMSTLAGVEGKKVLVLASEGFPMQPGREAFYYIDEVAKQKQGWNAMSGSSMIEGMSFDASQLIQSVAKTANANGITMYTVHAAGLQMGDDSNSAENARPTPVLVNQAIETNTTDSMRLMAEMTGGLASVNNNNFKGAFEKIQHDLDSYYSLGYRAAGTERVDRQRSIEVRLKNNPNKYLVRSRQSFVEKSTYAEMSDRVIANLLYTTKSNDLHVLVRMGRPTPTDDELFHVPVEIQIPMESLTFLPQGEAYVGGFDVYVAVANKDGDMSDVSRKSNQITIPAGDLPKTKGKYYTYSLELLMEPGLNKLSVGVVDQISNVTGFARDQIIAQDLR
jgi:VWFA-related protein